PRTDRSAPQRGPSMLAARGGPRGGDRPHAGQSEPLRGQPGAAPGDRTKALSAADGGDGAGTDGSCVAVERVAVIPQHRTIPAAILPASVVWQPEGDTTEGS